MRQMTLKITGDNNNNDDDDDDNDVLSVCSPVHTV